MEYNTRFCAYCGKKLLFDPDEPPRFCSFCGKGIAAAAEEPQPEPAAEQAEKSPAEPLAPGDVIRFAYGETSAPASNAAFATAEQERIFTGWLPEGFTGSAKHEANLGDADVPVILWAYANAPGRSYFFRKEKRYSVNKLAQNAENPFRTLEAYLDENAVQLLGTDAIRLLHRVAPFEQVEQKMLADQQSRRQQIESMGQGDFVRFVVQGQYSALGGRLYEAETGGQKKYLLLRVTMIADEYGSYSPSLIQSQQRTANMLRSMGAMVPFQAQAPAGMPVIDTDPHTPVGQHRTDGLSMNCIRWCLFQFGGFLSDTCPTIDEIRNFYRFLNSLKVAPECQQQLDALSQQIAMQQMQIQQQTANIMGQMVRDQQASFDRRSQIMKETADYRDQLFQQRLASDNAAFDRRVRQNHEMIMGVNTFMGTDGRPVEADVRYDRVFQKDNDPTQLLGAGITADVPFGWTELDQLK